MENDTIRLLRECDAGVKMGAASIQEVIDKAQSAPLRSCLSKSRDEHDQAQAKIQKRLQQYHDEGKEPSLMAKGMSWVKTNVEMAIKDSDPAIASFITDGCNMGVKSLSRYLNQYPAADEDSKGIAKGLIRLEEGLAAEVRPFL